jgi:hypothetical protein
MEFPAMSWVGPAIQAGGALLGGLLGGGKSGWIYPGVGKFTHNQLRAYRKYGEKFGFHPLELLRAGAGLGPGGGGGGSSGVATRAAITGTFDALSDIMTGRSAKQEQREEVEDDIRRIERDILKGELDRMTATGGGAFSTSAAATSGKYTQKFPTGQGPYVKTQFGNIVLGQLQWPTPLAPDGGIDVSISDGGTGVTMEGRKRIVTSSGESIDMTAGQDFGEMVSGAFANATTQIREKGVTGFFDENRPKFSSVVTALTGGERGRLNDMAFENYTKNINEKPPIKWDSRFGYRKPDDWDRWDNKARMAFIYWRNKK